MPTYEYRCGKCRREWEAVRRIDDRNRETCCGRRAEILIPRTQGRPVVLGYFDENLNAKITGPRQKREVMRRMDVAEV